jgi:hypothetical protein
MPDVAKRTSHTDAPGENPLGSIVAKQEQRKAEQQKEQRGGHEGGHAASVRREGQHAPQHRHHLAGQSAQ